MITYHSTEEWVCECGNESYTGGFYPCDPNGRIVEPSMDGEWGGLYVCDRCDRLRAFVKGD